MLHRPVSHRYYAPMTLAIPTAKGGLLRAALPVMALSLLSCQAPEQELGPTYVALSPREQLIRLSMDLRGVHPTEEELKAIESDPDLYPQLVDRYLQSQDFLDRMMEVFNHTFLTRTGDTYYDPDEAGLGMLDEVELARSVGDEPLRLVRYIIENDLPYSEVVLAPYTLTDEQLAVFWDIDYPEGSAGWITSQYRDGRPMAGVLSMTSFWKRYPSAGGNANRHRANAISRVLLCDDFLTRPIVINRTAIDLLMMDPENAIRNTPACQACHSSLDPLAANLFGFWYDPREQETLEEQRVYRAENELEWKNYAGRSPAWFGTPTANLHELGASIAADPRFVDCAVKTVWEGLTQRRATDEDWTELQGHRATFELTNQNIRSLVREIVLTDAYRAKAVQNDPGLEARLPSLKIASPAQLANVIEQVTGYRWTFSGQDALDDNARGLSVLAGGIDSRTVKKAAESPSLGLSLVQERLAQAAAYSVVAHDFSATRVGDPILLTVVGPGDTPASRPDAFVEQIQALYLKATGLPLEPSSPEPLELMTLWDNVFAITASPTSAWQAVVSAVLRDPRVVLY